MIKTLNMRFAHWREMQHHVSKQAPLEACGLLAGKKDFVERVLKIGNAAQSPVRFLMDPQEQYNALIWIEDNELDLVGIYHSHPLGPETASATDIAEAAYEAVHIIWSPAGNTWSARGFWIEGEKMIEVKLRVL